MNKPALTVVTLAALLLCACSGRGVLNALELGQDVAATDAVAARPAPLARVDNFMLVDAQTLEAHELRRMSGAKAIVLVSTGVGCPIARAMVPALKALRDRFAAQGVAVYLVDSNLQDSRDDMVAEAKKFDIGIPILMDSDQIVGEGLGVTRTAEVFVIDPMTWTVAYHGPVDDSADYGVVKAATKTYALDAVTAVLAGQPVPIASLESKGCLVAFPERDRPRAISYARDVAPILESKCVSCHQEGGIGPFAMTDYKVVRGYAPMIREVIRTHRMPPWNADPHVGAFADDKSLSSDQVKTLVHWIEAGAPRGEGPDPLAATHHVAPEWPLGNPDLILDVPAFTIPATGVVDYQHPYVLNPLTEGRWLRASTFKVESRQGVHHLLSGYLKDIPSKPGQAFESQWGSSMGTYTVGSESEIAPKNVGTYLPPGGAIGIQAHYTPFGKEVTDHARLGLYFYKPGERPALVMHTAVIADNSISIPANDPHRMETAYMAFSHAALLYAALPHAHYRGAASDLWIQYPDGKQTLLLSLPRYDFSWQRDYTFAKPIAVPAGSKLIAHYIYDNSRNNPHNPDPNRVVPWGNQSTDEMLFTQIRYRWVDETSAKPNSFDSELDAGRLMGMLDDNLDGKVERSELEGRFGGRFLKYFDLFDKNHDGVLDRDELAAAQKAMSGASRP